MEKTEVSNWLARVKEEAHAEKFREAGFEKVSDITDKNIEDIFSKEKVGFIARMKRLLVEEKARLANRLPTPDIPDLPEGKKLDLSNKQIELDGVSFSIPTTIPASNNGEVFSPYELTKAHWISIIRNTHCLYGKVIGSNGPRDARKPVLFWKVPKNDNYVLGKSLGASVTSEMKYTSQSSNFVRSGFHKGSASFKAPFVSGAGSYEHSEKRAKSTKYKTIHMLGIWDFPRAQLFLDECTAVSDEFVDAVTHVVNELKEGEKDDEIKAKQRSKAIEALNEVFNDYGHIVGNTLDLGGRLYFTHKEKATGTVNESEKRQVASAALSIKTFSGSGSASYQGETSSSSVKEAQNLSKTINFRAKGGDTTLANNPAEWAGTIKDPNLWAIIRYYKTQRTIDLLPDDIREKVEILWRDYMDAPLHNKTFHFENAFSMGSVMSNKVGSLISAAHTSTLAFEHKWVVSDPENQATKWKLMTNSYYKETNLYFIQDTSGRYLSFQKFSVSVPNKPPIVKWGLGLVDKIGSQNTGSDEVRAALWRIYPVTEEATDFNEGMYYIECFANPSVKLHQEPTYWAVAGGDSYHNEDPDGDGRREMWYFIPAQ